MKRLFRPCLCAAALALWLGGAPTAAAQGASQETTESEALTDAQKEAREHFERAKGLYQTGAYRDAITELEQARALDPDAKDLIFNLGIVHERLGDYDQAIGYFQEYVALTTITDAERARAETILRRIEGAKHEADEKKAAQTKPVAPAASSSTSEPATQAKPSRGRVDAATLTATSLAVVGLGVGAAFGIRALSLDPSEFVRGRDGTYDDLRRRADDAHTSAVIADVGFGVGILSAALATYLYFGRTKASPSVHASAGPLPGGASVGLVGVLP